MQVNCEASYSGCGHPKAFFWQNRRFTVQAIIKEWREPDTKHYLVSTDLCNDFELILDETSGCWRILEKISMKKPLRSIS